MPQSPSQTVGPFFHYGLIHGGDNILVNNQTKGERIQIVGQVLDGDGVPIPDAMVEIWQADSGGYFNHPGDPRHTQADPHFRGFGRCDTTGEGFWFRTIKPGVFAGEMVPFVSVQVFSRGLLIHTLTRIYFSDYDNLRDPVFAAVDPQRRQTLVAQRHETPEGPVYHWDIRMQGQGETVFFDLY